MSIVITGASGQLGRLTAELVLDRVPAPEVILTTRRPEALSDLAERGATVRQADFDQPETLAEAFAGPAPRRHRGGQGGRRASRSLHFLPQPS
jgi:NAD(P)H dehydrogenase (quinone)